MITLSLNLDGITGKTERSSHEKRVREIVGTHLAFPGSDKLKMGVTIKDNGSSSVTFAGPREIVSEAKRLWEENVVPATDRVKSAAQRGLASTFKKPAPPAKSKRKKVRVTVKASVIKKSAPKKKAATKKKK